MAVSEVGTTKPESRKTEHLRLMAIFAVLVVLIAVPAWLWNRHEKSRPRLVEARVVSATTADPVFREGTRSVADDESVQLAVAICLEYPHKGSRWLAPVEHLVLDGTTVDHLQTAGWPEEDRLLRVFWFTLEPPYLGGQLTSDNAASKLALQSFYAPELGRGLAAEGEPEAHADDGVNLGTDVRAVAAGTYRVYVRVEVVAKAGSAHSSHVATSLSAEAVDDPRMLRISRRLSPDLGLDPLVGELFRLPGFELEETDDLDIQDLADRRIATSSEIFAAVAATGRTRLADSELEAVSTFQWKGESIATGEDPWRWGSDIRAQDILRQGEHWLVAVADDGDGLLGPGDLAAHAWHRPAALLPLGIALDDEPATIELHRAIGGSP